MPIAAAAASQLLQHSSRNDAQSPHSPAVISVASLHSIRRPQDLYITLSTVQWKEGLSLNIGYLRAVTYAFFINLERWKFPYENRLIEIPRESRENIAYDRCPNCECLCHQCLYLLRLILLLHVFSANKLHPASMHGLFMRLLIS